MINPEWLKTHLGIRIHRIEDLNIQTLVWQVIEALPARTWERESSFKHHPTDEREPGGNLLHTLKVSTLIEVLLDAAGTDPLDRDIVRAAAILHDCCRHGLAADEPYSARNHPHLVRQLIQRHNIRSPWAGQICNLIETHMGRWGHPPHLLTTTPNDILHLADCIAAQTFVQVTI